MPNHITNELTTLFVGTVADGKYRNNIAWIKDGWKFACNGHIGIAIATDEPNTEYQGFESIGRTLALPDGPSFSWPTEFMSLECECDECDGWGRVNRETCSRCKGDGEVMCDMYHYHSCPECDTSGKTGGERCPVCFGAKRGNFPHHQVVASRWVKAKFGRLILTLPSVRFIQDGFTDPKRMVSFIFDGGHGGVMPTLPPGHER